MTVKSARLLHLLLAIVLNIHGKLVELGRRYAMGVVKKNGK
jgi:hypothetical protein